MTEMVETFISDAQGLADEFHEFSDELLSGRVSDETVNAMFRSVHSLKGGSSFLISEDARLGVLSKFCHDFENFMDLVRKGRVKVDRETGGMVLKGLDLIAGDLDSLRDGREISPHVEFIEKLACISLVTVEVVDELIIFRVTKDIKLEDEVDRFASLVIKEIEASRGPIRIVVDLQNRHKLSSLSFGAIFGFLDSVESIFFLQPSAFMRSLIERFGVEKQGIRVCQTLEECAAGR